MNRRLFIGLAGAAVVGSQLPACSSARKQPVADVPRSTFDKNSTADEVLQGIDLTGKLALVTG